MSIRIALAGNPNSGKTTLFNVLTGARQHVGNWPGVTVEKKEGTLKAAYGKSITLVDLPGIYSLSPYSGEEIVARNYLISERPDVIINIVDGSNLERNLYLTTHLMETKIPVVIALNMGDILEKQGDEVDIEQLAKQFKCPVVIISALKETGISDLIKTTLAVVENKAEPKTLDCFDDKINEAIIQIQQIIALNTTAEDVLYYATKLLEKDEIMAAQLALNSTQSAAIEEVVARIESDYDDDTQSIISSLRYQFIQQAVSASISLKKQNNVSLSTSDKIDRIVTNRWLSIPIFALVMYLIYYVSIQTIGDLTIGYVETIFAWLGEGLTAILQTIGASETIISLLIDGALAGIGAIFTFVPQMMILFFFISFLEDSGYMARIAFIMDRIFRRFGLSGKSFIPFIIGTGCSVPAIMASRTIENESDRKMTIILTPFIPCSAKLPVFALMAGALFPNDAWVAPSMYFLGIFMVIICGVILKKTKIFTGEPAPFVMELPPYRYPAFKNVIMHMYERGKSFIVKAGTLIFSMSVIIWVLMSFNWQFQLADQADSILASLGKFAAPVFAPLGYGTWQAAVAQVTGLLAKETMVSTFGVLLRGMADLTEESPDLILSIQSMFTQNSAYSFMIFTLLAAPCMAAIGATKRELITWKNTLPVIAFQCGMAYLMAFLAFQLHLFDVISWCISYVSLPYVWIPLVMVIAGAIIIRQLVISHRKAKAY